jgi:hypothetical protein
MERAALHSGFSGARANCVTIGSPAGSQDGAP